jgi:hypothetical protein
MWVGDIIRPARFGILSTVFIKIQLALNVTMCRLGYRFNFLNYESRCVKL